MKSAQHLDRFRHRFRREKSRPEYALAKARDFPVLVDLSKTPPSQACDLQPN
jgi:hypothetical protein